MFRQQKILILFILITLVVISNTNAQIPLLPMVMGNGGGGVGGGKSLPAFNSSRVLILDNVKTGRKDTIRIGDHVKFKFETNRDVKVQQSLIQSDFNKNTFKVESDIVNIDDSTFTIMPRPVNPVPLPIPIPLALFKKKDKTVSPFVTVKISEVQSFSSFSESLKMGVQQAVDMPTTTFFPESFTTWPNMLYVMPAKMIFTEIFGGSVFSAHSVNNADADADYRLYTFDTGIKTIGLRQKLAQHKEDEWQFERITRLDSIYEIKEREWLDIVLTQNKGNKIISFTIGGMFIPGYEHASFDSKTKVEIQDKKRVMGFAIENFITEKIRIGTEMQMHATERAMYMTTNGSMNGGGGFIMSNFAYFKFGIGDGIYGQKKRERMKVELENFIPNEYDGQAISAYNLKRQKLMSEPKPYLLFGAGAVNTTLIRLKGSQSTMDATEYTQKKLAIEGGFGLYSRITKRFTYDMSAKYLWSPKYSPSIGSIRSYSGFRFQLNIGYMTGPSFNKMRQELKLIEKNY